jgi:outer membrane protein assembly factor BamB
MPSPCIRNLLAVGTAIALTATASAQTWQQFHGGVGHPGTWDGHVSPDTVNLAWTFDPADYALDITDFLRDSQPAVAADAGLIFAYGHYADFSDRGLIVAIDTVTGEFAWTATVVTAALWDEVASPVYHEGYVYWAGSDTGGGMGPFTGHVYKINALNGSTAAVHGGWEATFPGEGFINAAPVIADGRVFVTTYVWANGTKHIALDDANGTTLWINDTVGGNGGGAPAYDAARGLLYQTTSPDGQTRISALAAANGTVTWSSPFTLTAGDYQLGVTYANNRIYVQDFAFGGADGTLYVADAANEETPGALLWSAATRGSADTAPAVDPQGNVYAGGDLNSVPWPGKEAGRTRAFSAAGNPLWTVENAGGTYGSPAWAGDMIFVGDQSANNLYLLDDTDGSVLATVAGSGPVSFGIHHFYTTGTTGVLYAYNTGANYACTGMYSISLAVNDFQREPKAYIQGLGQAGAKVKTKTAYYDNDVIISFFKKSTKRYESVWTDLYANSLRLNKFRVPPPSATTISTLSPVPGGLLELNGYFWGPKNPKVAMLEQLPSGRVKRYRCKVESAVMMPETGESMLQCILPDRLADGTYELELTFRHTSHRVSVPGIRVSNE